MPSPKFVIAVGACAYDGGVFKGSYSLRRGAKDVVPVDVYVPGCPPRPEAILNGIVKLLQKIEKLSGVESK
jgi:NADH:ubiquinone oxidoreductase subunit B-like Fe-S oxidoreductase